MNPNIVEQSAAALGVGSGAVLGCVLLWLARMLLLMALVVEIKVLTMLYKDKSEYKQRRRKSDERPSQTNKHAGLPLQSAAGYLGKLADSDGNLGLLNGNQSCRRDNWSLSGKAVNLLFRASYPILKLIGCHKTKDVAKQPKSMSENPRAGRGLPRPTAENTDFSVL